MPRYFFDTDDGLRRDADDIGVELADDQAARDAGARALGEMAREYLPRSSEPQKNITIWVRNEAGEAILQLALTFAVQQPGKP
jgi:hypothetical protein